MTRLTLFLTFAVSLGTVAIVGWSCSPDKAPFEANPVSSSTSYSAKVVTSYNPFSGLDEDGYFKGVGSGDNYRDLLQIYARRIALIQQDASARKTLVSAVLGSDNGRVNIVSLLTANPDIAILHHSRDNLQMDADRRRIVGASDRSPLPARRSA